MRPSLLLLLGLAGLFPAKAVLADDNVKVDVIVNLTDAGKKIDAPTPDHPIYYLPIPAGYKESGDKLNSWQRPPPQQQQVVALLAQALDEQGYHIMTHAHHPSLVLIVWWGYMAPQVVESDYLIDPNEVPGGGVSGGNSIQRVSATSTTNYEENDIPITQMTNGAEMLSLTGGEHFRYDKSASMDPRSAEVFAAAGVPRYYLTVRAIDFNDWLHHKDTPYWTAHVSAPYWGHYLDETLPALVKAGAPLFGRDMARPQMVDASVVPFGRVEVGAPVVKGDY